MDKRRLAKRLFRIAELRERFARIRRGEAARAIRDQEDHITSLDEKQADARRAIHSQEGPIDSKWHEALETARQAHEIKRDTAEVELGHREEVHEEERKAHVDTIDSMRSAEKVKERVVGKWRDEQETAERKELDDLGGVHIRRRKKDK